MVQLLSKLPRTMSRRPRRTRVYDCNYDLGESYYRPAIDRLDRKFTGRPLEPAAREPSLPVELQERFDRAFQDEDLSTSRRRAEKHIKENHLFDSRGALTERADEARALSVALDARANDDGFDDEFSGVLQRMKASRKKILDDVDLEGTVSNINSRRTLGMSEKLLDSVGINEVSVRRIQNGESSMALKRRSFLDEELEPTGPPILEKWTALVDKDSEVTSSAAAARARQSRARLNDLEEEMEAMNQKHAARERRVAQLRALVNESSDESSQVLQSSMKSARISSRSEKKTVTF